MHHFALDLPTPTAVYVHNGAVAEARCWPEAPGPGTAAAVLVDQHLLHLFPELGTHITTALSEQGWTPWLRPVEASEALKSMEAVFPLYGELLEQGIRRQGLLVAVGGGTVGDAMGFLAATYLRGIDWVNVPTTLLAQVDSSLGGKTGINHPAGKNLLGAIHQPRHLICDPGLLGALPRREWLSGLGEMLKYGLIHDARFWQQLVNDREALLAGAAAELSAAIARSLEIKAHYVERDERDLMGIRAALNFGHTFAHGLEAALGYGALRHGEAVIQGMILSIMLSQQEGLLPETRADEWLSVLQPLAPLSQEEVQAVPRKAFLTAMQKDKKNQDHRIQVLCISDYAELHPRLFSEIDLDQFLNNLA